MEIGKTLYATERKAWRAWLAEHHSTEKEIWLVYCKKHTGKPRIPYNDAVEEALCYGWIDSTGKKVDDDRTAQRFSPRREKSPLSEMNKERARRLIKSGKMTEAGLAKIRRWLNEKFVAPKDILEELKQDALVWKNFKKFPASYRTIRLGFIEGARKRPAEFRKRLNYFIKKTRQNKKFGMVQ
ncbi:MAG: YdeI/OmpD-associated family protein [Candidatus Diapherotrites archaeon]|nr:YdeI/OmpD-associated family protein [Candidatus Diapherotrites archaeon]